MRSIIKMVEKEWLGIGRKLDECKWQDLAERIECDKAAMNAVYPHPARQRPLHRPLLSTTCLPLSPSVSPTPPASPKSPTISPDANPRGLGGRPDARIHGLWPGSVDHVTLVRRDPRWEDSSGFGLTRQGGEQQLRRWGQQQLQGGAGDYYGEGGGSNHGEGDITNLS